MTIVMLELERRDRWSAFAWMGGEEERPNKTYHSPPRFQSFTSLFEATCTISPINDPTFSFSFSAAFGSGLGGKSRTMAKSPKVSFVLYSNLSTLCGSSSTAQQAGSDGGLRSLEPPYGV